MSIDLISESASRLFAQHDVTAGGAWPEGLWRAAEEAGYPLAFLSEDEGGFGLGPEEAVAPLRIAARFAAPLPLAETMLANWLLARAGLPPATGAAAVSDAPARKVPWGRALSALVVAEPAPDGLRVSLFDAAACRWRDGHNLAGEPRDDLTEAPDPAMVATAPVALGVPQAMLAILRTQQIAGAVAAALDLSVRYASERMQFGRPLARFQVIQQYLAVMADETAAASAAATMAALALPLARTDPSRFRLLAGAAKLRAGEAAGKLAELSHQVHGAIGFSQEYLLHPLTRRLWAWRDEAGTEADWAEELGRSLGQRRAEGLWPQVTEMQAGFF